MLLPDYFAEITAVIADYSKTGLIISSDINVDSRTEKLGLIKGALVFIDYSTLFIMEYVDVRYKIEKLSYAYHYQDKESSLIFRYDNAVHKPKLDFIEHKHTGEKTISAGVPEIADILEEILLRIRQI
jgi:hypothetical protein